MSENRSMSEILIPVNNLTNGNTKYSGIKRYFCNHMCTSMHQSNTLKSYKEEKHHCRQKACIIKGSL